MAPAHISAEGFGSGASDRRIAPSRRKRRALTLPVSGSNFAVSSVVTSPLASATVSEIGRASMMRASFAAPPRSAITSHSDFARPSVSGSVAARPDTMR